MRRLLCWLAGVIMILSLSIYATRGFWVATIRAYYFGRIYIASEELGRRLPQVDEVEILALDGEVAEGIPDSFGADLGSTIGTVSRRTVRGAEAELVADIWRGLDFDRRFAALCFSPYYALRFRHQGKLILETSVCWHCSSYTLPIGILGSVRNGFDAKSAEGKRLLNILTHLCPHPTASK